MFQPNPCPFREKRATPGSSVIGRRGRGSPATPARYDPGTPPGKPTIVYLESFVKTERKGLDKLLRDEFLTKMWESKTTPKNPALEIKDGDKPLATAIFSLVKKWHIENVKAKHNETPDVAFMRTLVEVAGMDPDQATMLVNIELDFTPRIFIDMSALEASDDATDQSAVRKLTDYLAGEIESPDLDDEEKAVIITIEATVKVLDGFMDRLCGYCESLKQLDTVLTTLIKPEWRLNSVKYGVSDPEDKRLERLLDQCRQIIEGADEEEAKK